MNEGSTTRHYSYKVCLGRSIDNWNSFTIKIEKYGGFWFISKVENSYSSLCVIKKKQVNLLQYLIVEIAIAFPPYHYCLILKH